jgi:hypothetical protein
LQKPVEAEITIDVGEPFVLFISFNLENFKFGFIFNNEELDKYEIPRGDFVNLEKVTSEGDMTVNFVGFTNPGIIFFL